MLKAGEYRISVESLEAVMAKKMGRPTSYRPKLCDSLIEFFSVAPIVYKKDVAKGAPTPYFIDWCVKVDIDYSTFQNWTDPNHASFQPDFFLSYKNAEKLQERFIIECALKGVHNPTFSIFTMKNVCGWRDERHLDQTKDSAPIETILVELLKKRATELKDGEAIKITRTEHRALDKFIS